MMEMCDECRRGGGGRRAWVCTKCVGGGGWLWVDRVRVAGRFGS